MQAKSMYLLPSYAALPVLLVMVPKLNDLIPPSLPGPGMLQAMAGGFTTRRLALFELLPLLFVTVRLMIFDPGVLYETAGFRTKEESGLPSRNDQYHLSGPFRLRSVN